MSKRYTHAAIVGCRMRPFWVVRYRDCEGLTNWLSSASGARGLLCWTDERSAAFEHADRHDAYAARDEVRKTFADVGYMSMSYLDDRHLASDVVQVVRGYR